MTLKIYQIDTFTDTLFNGNPAAVCPLNDWLSDDILQKIANENNLAETAFYIKQNVDYEIRWFTPTTEIDLCGHATLASAFVLFNIEKIKTDIVRFNSRKSGQLTVKKSSDGLLTLNFPTDSYQKVAITNELSNCVGALPIEILKGKFDYMFVFETESQIRKIIPNLDAISKLKSRGLIITAQGKDSDFVSRFFAPQNGIAEDHVTGSAHTTLIPYWAKKLSKNTLSAIQVSERQGFLQCKFLGERVEIGGNAKLYLKGDIFLN